MITLRRLDMASGTPCAGSRTPLLHLFEMASSSCRAREDRNRYSKNKRKSVTTERVKGTTTSDPRKRGGFMLRYCRV